MYGPPRASKSFVGPMVIKDARPVPGDDFERSGGEVPARQLALRPVDRAVSAYILLADATPSDGGR